MHEQAFAQAILPRRVVVLGLALRPFSVAHELWLSRKRTIALQNLSAASEQAELRASVIRAVLICHHSHAQLLAMDSDRWLHLKSRLWRWRIRKANFPLAAADFAAYRAAGSTEPPLVEQGSRGTPPRPCGAPFLLRLVQFLVLRMGLTEDAALDYPYGAAIWHYCAYHEAAGGLQIRNRHDDEADAFVREQEELAANGQGYFPQRTKDAKDVKDQGDASLVTRQS